MRRYFLIGLLAALGGCSRAPEPVTREQPPAAAPAPIAKDDRPVLVVFGDSISAGFGLQAGQSFPDDLQKLLDADEIPWRVVNLGISGDTTDGGLARIDSATSLKPRVVVLELGGNDGLRGTALKTTRENLDRIIVEFQKGGAKVVLAGMSLPPNYGSDYIRGFEKIYKDLAAQHKVALIPFLMADIVTTDMRYVQADGIHPTAEGSRMIAQTVMRAVKPLLK